MAPSRRRRSAGTSRGYSRADRLNELLREIVAETIERIDDDRLQLVTITAVDVDRELEHAKIYYSTLDGDDRAEAVVEAFDELRGRVRKAIGNQATLRRVPQLHFQPDDVVRGAQRIDEILASMPGRDQVANDDSIDDAGDRDRPDADG